MTSDAISNYHIIMDLNELVFNLGLPLLCLLFGLFNQPLSLLVVLLLTETVQCLYPTNRKVNTEHSTLIQSS